MSVQFVCRCRRFLSIACAFAALVVFCGHSKTLLSKATITTVMNGLDNPRGLAFAPDGAPYVVEAGRGGDFCFDLRGLLTCSGASGALTRLRHGVQERVAIGFPSHINPRGEVTGAHDVAFLGVVSGPDGAYYVSELTGAPFTAGAANIYRVVVGQALVVRLGDARVDEPTPGATLEREAS